jgi:transposase
MVIPMHKIPSATIQEIKYLLSSGFSIRAVQSKTDISKSSIHRIYSELKSPMTKNSPGRSSKLNPRVINKISRGVEQGIFQTCSDIKKYIQVSADITVGRETIRCLLLKKGYKNYSKPKKPRLLSKHKVGRMKFVRSFISVPELFW